MVAIDYVLFSKIARWAMNSPIYGRSDTGLYVKLHINYRHGAGTAGQKYKSSKQMGIKVSLKPITI